MILPKSSLNISTGFLPRKQEINAIYTIKFVLTLGMAQDKNSIFV